MGFAMPPVLTLVGIACTGLGLVLQIVGLATPGWVVANVGDIGIGLFQLCAGSSGCVTLDNFKDFVYACRAFGILAVLLLFICLVTVVVQCFQQTHKLALVPAISALVAALCCLIEFAVFAGETTTTSEASFGYSFALTIVACVLSLAAGTCFLVGKLRSSAYQSI